MKPLLIFIVFLAGFAILGCGIGDDAEETDPLLIIPGRQVGDISLGDPRSKVVRLYGTPKEEEYAHMLSCTYSSIRFYLDENGVTLIIVSSDRYKTRGGNRVGSSIESVEKEFGTTEDTGFDGDLFWYSTIGIAFGISGSGDKVIDISIFRQLRAAPSKSP